MQTVRVLWINLCTDIKNAQDITIICEIYTSPRLQVEVTNLSDPTKIVDLTVTGAFHETINANGDRVTIMTGRNLVTDPEAGMALIMGTFSYVVDSAGTLIQPLLGQGKIVDICELIS